MTRTGLRLDELARELPGAIEIEGDASVIVRGVHHDSRSVEAGDLFVARKGARADGAAFARTAKEKGARAILVAKDSSDVRSLDLPRVFVDDVDDALAFASAAIYGHPAFSLDIIGITGTNGKTTTTHLVRAAIDGATGTPSCGTIGTVGHRFRDLEIDAAHTTPEADELARILSAMLARGATSVAMEVSSIAIVRKRVRAVRFRVAAFTNLTQDHLDFHGSMDAYAAAKKELFTSYAPGSAVINVADDFGRALARDVHGPLVRVTHDAKATASDAEIAPRRVTFSSAGIDAIVRTPNGDVHLRSRLVGAHNLENLLVTLGIAYALDLDLTKVVDTLANENAAPGRLERCDEPVDDVTVLVDYAHTPDALARVLDSVRAFSNKKMWCVFGCGGDRDASKRQPMGLAVAERADIAIITSDNPRSEDPSAIAKPIEGAVLSTDMKRIDLAAKFTTDSRSYGVELDRAKAIAVTIARAEAGDVIVIAGKGHEDYQIIGDRKIAFDDRVEARRALALRRAHAATGGR